MSDSESRAFSSFNNLGVVITRPESQSKELEKKIQKVGGCPFLFPLIEITPFNDKTTQLQLGNLQTYDLILFVSSNAVEQLINLVGTNILKTKTLVTIGKKTANTLNKHGLDVDLYPTSLFNSEALLSIDKFREHSKDKNIAIIRGSSGRDYLRNNLVELGASVDYINVYTRHCPQQNLLKLKQFAQGKTNVVVLLTSASSTASFFKLANNEKWINELILLIGSPRMQHEIPVQFKGKILIADDPSDETLFKKLKLELK